MNYFTLKNTAIFIVLLFFSCGVHAQIVSQNSQGKLVYQNYANRGQTNAVNKVPDFSNAGYRGGGVAIPNNIPVRETVNPGNGDDRARIQAAIDRVGARSADANGFRGAVLLKKGTYQVEGILKITKSGVVLRGEGQGSVNGTKIIATGQDKRSLIIVEGQGGPIPVTGTTTDITQNFVPVGSNTIQVSRGSVYRVGQDIIVERRPNQKWLDDMDKYESMGMDTRTICCPL
jgi:hypothetical protein